MKKTIALLTALVLVILLSSCSSNQIAEPKHFDSIPLAEMTDAQLQENVDYFLDYVSNATLSHAGMEAGIRATIYQNEQILRQLKELSRRMK